MAATFRDFSRRHREIHLDVTDGLSRDLTQRYRDGEFDIVIVKGSRRRPRLPVLVPGTHGLVRKPERAARLALPVPLVTFPPGGLYRDAMFERLSASGCAGTTRFPAAACTTC